MHIGQNNACCSTCLVEAASGDMTYEQLIAGEHRQGREPFLFGTNRPKGSINLYLDFQIW